jgi:hypothetical protein
VAPACLLELHPTGVALPLTGSSAFVLSNY